MAKEISFEEAAHLHGMSQDALMDACNRYIDRAPKVIRQDRGTRKKYFNPDEMSKFIDWHLGREQVTRADGTTRVAPRTDLEIQEAELVRANLAIDRNTKRVATCTVALEKAEADLAKSLEKKAKAEKAIAFFKKQKRRK